jgi:hypothetical protein
MRRFAIIAAFLLLIALSVPAPAQDAQEGAQIAFAIERGRLLFEIDRAAWVATDDATARLRGAAGAGLRGYIVEADGAGFAVTFFGGPQDAPVAYYRGRVANRRVTGGEVFPAAARPPLTAAQRRLAGLREVAARLDHRPCGGAQFNMAAIPPATPDGAIDLYLLTPQTRNDAWPFGGHYRVTVNADGSVASSRAFTNSCLNLAPPRDAIFIGVTHLLDPVPTEIHVFTALSSGHTVLVAAGERLFQIEGDRISIVNPPVASPKS